MKVAINTCYGGFGLSPLAIQRLAELQGKQAYFFAGNPRHYRRIDMPDKGMFWTAFSVPNPGEIMAKNPDATDSIYISTCPEDRTDTLLIQVIEELGDMADGVCAKLKVMEIPDDIEYTIEEYAGNERIAEVHRTWS